jgi:hypothetical protein
MVLPREMAKTSDITWVKFPFTRARGARMAGHMADFLRPRKIALNRT